MKSRYVERIPQFRYEGGKGNLRKWIMPYIPRSGSLYVEPFAGRGNIFWETVYRCKYESWLLNDIRTYTFYDAIKRVDLNQLPEVITQLEKEEFIQRKKAGDLLALVMEPLMCWGGSNLGESTFVAGKWAVYNRIEYYHRIKTCRAILEHTQCEITSIDYTQLPWGDWDESVFVYIDPPYLKCNVNAYSENDFDHLQMIEILKTTKARWLLSEYRQDIYLKEFGEPSYNKKTRAMMGPGHPERLECLWSNFIPKDLSLYKV